MSMLCLGPSESQKIISTAFRLTPYSLMMEVVTTARSTRDGEESRPVSRRRPSWENGLEDGRERVATVSAVLTVGSFLAEESFGRLPRG